MRQALKAYLINLDRSADRLAHMQAAFAGAGVTFRRVAAVDGAALEAASLEAFRQEAPRHTDWRPGEIGCFLSHLDAWRHIANNPDSFGAIFEDDIHVSPELGRLLASADWIPPDADLVRLEANRPMRLSDGRTIPSLAHRKVYRALSGTSGTAAYILAREAAARLCDAASELRMPADLFLFKPKVSPMARQLSRYQIVPALCVQEGIMQGDTAALESLIKPRTSRGRGYRDSIHPLLRLWPIRRHAVPFRR